MRFQTPLRPARLIRRYKRFLADIRLEDGPDAGTEVTAHIANPGSMMGLARPDTRIWVDQNDDPKKKLNFGWRLVDHENGHLTCVDTAIPNRVVREALLARAIPPLSAYGTILPEQKYAEASRVDFLLREQGLADCYVEVKAVTLSRAEGQAEFPDSVTARGARHMADLAAMCAAGHRAVLLFLVQRTDAQSVGIAADIDPAYAGAVRDAMAAGVEVLCLSSRITPEDVTCGPELPFRP